MSLKALNLCLSHLGALRRLLIKSMWTTATEVIKLQHWADQHHHQIYLSRPKDYLGRLTWDYWRYGRKETHSYRLYPSRLICYTLSWVHRCSTHHNSEHSSPRFLRSLSAGLYVRLRHQYRLERPLLLALDRIASWPKTIMANLELHLNCLACYRDDFAHLIAAMGYVCSKRLS